MPRQKLPEGWNYCEVDPSVVEYKRGWPEVLIGDGGNLELDDGEFAVRVRPDIALAVIRNAGLDRVYTLVKELLASDDDPNDAIGWCIITEQLRTLIESLEEP